MTRLAKRPSSTVPPQDLSAVLLEEPQCDVRDVDHLTVVSRIWDELGLTNLTDDCITHDPQQAMSGGQVQKALVLNVTGGRDPLYRERHWAEQVPLSSCSEMARRPSISMTHHLVGTWIACSRWAPRACSTRCRCV
jgi:hypothetical protein